MKWGLLFSTLLFSAICGAESLRTKALAEAANIPGQNQKSASDAQTGMLTLQDPRPEIITRSWKYSVAFTLQQFQAEGRATKDGTGTFDLGKNGQTVMPGVEIGVLTAPMATGPVQWKLGAKGKASFASQETEVVLDSGYKINDVRLNTTLLSAGPVVAVNWDRINWLSLTVSPQFGTMSYAQASSNDFANFSKSASYASWNYGLDFALSKKWSVFTEWSQRSLNDNNEIALQKDNFELGTKISW